MLVPSNPLLFPDLTPFAPQARLRNMPNAPRTQATVPWTARVVSRERSLELFSLCADVGVSVIDLLPRVLFIAHFKLRKDVPINNSVVSCGWVG